MKTNELTGPALDWAVAKCEGIGEVDKFGGVWVLMPNEPHFNEAYTPSTDWAQGGPIIEREGIATKQWLGAWQAEVEFLPDDDTHYRYGRSYGPTPLITAMRCYVASKLGDNIDIPEELT